MESVISILNLVLIILVFVILSLIALYFVISVTGKNKKKDEEVVLSDNKNTISTAQGVLSIESIKKFMEFDEIKDNMIVRKNRGQYVMVIQCQGVNYDLLSEQEKIAVEEGFVQFLNTLRFPIQLYVQTRSLNLKDIIEEYKGRVKNIETDVNQLRTKIKDAQENGENDKLEMLQYEERRKVNVLEYGADITEYIGRLSLNKNVLQQKTYVIVPYATAEFGSVATYSKEEIDNICFSELYTRCQSIIRSLASSEVTGRILDSEELSELLYIAYNRDDSDLIQFRKALDAEYNSLYNSGKDILQKKQDILNEQIEEKAIDIVTDSIIDADEKRKQVEEEREELIKKRAQELLEEYKDQMDADLFEGASKEIEKRTKKTKKTETNLKKAIKRKAI